MTWVDQIEFYGELGAIALAHVAMMEALEELYE